MEQVLDHIVLARMKTLGVKALRGELTQEEKRIIKRVAQTAWESVTRKVPTPFSFATWFYTYLYAELVLEIHGTEVKPSDIVALVSKWIAENSSVFCDPELLYTASVELVSGVDKVISHCVSSIEGHSSELRGIRTRHPELEKTISDILMENQRLLEELTRARSEVTRLRNMIDEFKKQLGTDALTKVVNRRGFDEKIAKTLEAVRNTSIPCCLIMVDIDDFKKVNDTYGHQAGDAVLYTVAQVLKAAVRSIDTVARYGGEEFAVILRNMTIEDAKYVADRIRKAVERSFVSHDGRVIRVTASLGVAQISENDTVQSLIERADAALYHAKRTGKNRVVTEHEVPSDKPSESESVHEQTRDTQVTDREAIRQRPTRTQRPSL